MSNNIMEAKRAWDIIFNDPNLSLSSLSHRAVAGTVCQNGLRSVCWKVFLGYLPTLEVSKWSSIQTQERQHYTDLKRKYIEEPTEKMNKHEQEDLSDNNPLALSDNNPWQQYFADSEIRKVIRQDVERTQVQQRLTDILFIYCKLNHDVSYRQGMHELLAPFYWVLAEESLEATKLEDDPVDPATKLMAQVLDSAYVEHDAYILFNKLMKHGKSWYEFNEQPNTSLNTKKDVSQTTIPKPNSRLNSVVTLCHRIHHQYLRTVDPYLYRHLENFGIEPQLYGIRWIRLLFGREFEIRDLLKLWDAIFAEDATFEIVEYVCLVMLLRMRDQLLNKDYAECLSMLMRPSQITKPASLVEQAKYLQSNLSEETALQILQQLDVRSGKDPRPSLSAGVPELQIAPVQPRPQRTLHHKSSQGGLDGFSRLTSNMMKNTQVRDLNRAIAGVMGTVQKNVNTFGENVLGKPQDNFVRRSTVSSEFPSGFDRIANQQQQRTQPILPTKPVDEQLAKLKATNHQMGELMNKCISLLENEIFPPPAKIESKEDQKVPEEEEQEKIDSATVSDADVTSYDSHNSEDEDTPKKQESQDTKPIQDDATIIMALVGLKHIRDVLTGKQSHFDASVIDMKSPNDEDPKKKEDEWKWDLVDPKEATPPIVKKPTSIFVPPQTSSPLLDVETPTIENKPLPYVPANPTPPKQQIKYRIEDLLSDPDLQLSSPKTTNTKFKWILENNVESPTNTLQHDLFKSEQPKLSPRKRNSFIIKKQHSDLSIKSSAATIDPLDAKNVDNRKIYEHDML
ncbi:hypothetical protein CU098_008334 [Rhizopus stolonifer]|uniref:Rab-GAP TBC domain-containing protein n=1 Tax=Rhizopus stolonifer TaxID=4846 RepID=A0A367K7E3_RHIST|nr:hypothetical protein CU098_008334 [Rhizopus stolonifer]